MSALEFIRRERSVSTGTTPPNCAFYSCNSSGLYRWELAGYVQGLVCGKHRNELQRAWDSAKGDE